MTTANAKVTITELQTQLEAATARVAELETQPAGRKGVYLEGQMKFWRQPTNPNTQEPMNFWSFVIANDTTKGEGANLKRVELPFDECRVTTARKELVEQLQQLMDGTRFRVIRVHGAWSDAGTISMNRGGYLRASGKTFWVTSFEVLHSLPIEEAAQEQPAQDEPAPQEPAQEVVDQELLPA